MSFIKSVIRFVSKDSPNINYSIGLETDVINTSLLWKLIPEITKRLAEEYAKDFGPEILKRIQEKTIEYKIIQKVVENLKNELSKNKLEGR